MDPYPDSNPSSSVFGSMDDDDFTPLALEEQPSTWSFLSTVPPDHPAVSPSEMPYSSPYYMPQLTKHEIVTMTTEEDTDGTTKRPLYPQQFTQEPPQQQPQQQQLQQPQQPQQQPQMQQYPTAYPQTPFFTGNMDQNAGHPPPPPPQPQQTSAMPPTIDNSYSSSSHKQQTSSFGPTGSSASGSSSPLRSSAGKSSSHSSSGSSRRGKHESGAAGYNSSASSSPASTPGVPVSNPLPQHSQSMPSDIHVFPPSKSPVISVFSQTSPAEWVRGLWTYVEDRQRQDLAIRKNQESALRHRNAEALRNLYKEERQLLENITEVIREVNIVEEKAIFVPLELLALDRIRTDLIVLQKSAGVLMEEAQAAMDTKDCSVTRAFAAFAITNQPFPLITSKSRILDAPLEATLITATYKVSNPLRDSFTAMIVTNLSTRQSAQLVAEVTKADIMAMNKVSVKLKMAAGSRMAPVTMRLGTKVPVTEGVSPEMVPVETQETEPFLVMTNENQFEDSSKSILMKTSFHDKMTIPWARFANAFQRHILQITRQDRLYAELKFDLLFVSESVDLPSSDGLPLRYLSLQELEYIHSRFFDGAEIITLEQFNAFWTWFGKIHQRFHSTRHISSLWREGYIWGFAARESVEAALSHLPGGSFCLRFSERSPGSFALTFRVDANEGHDYSIHHMLLRPEELSAQKTLPDTLHEIPKFLYIVRMSYSSCNKRFCTHNPLCPPDAVSLPKDEALKPFFSSKRPTETLAGYEYNVFV